MPKTLWSEAQEALVVALTQARKDAGLSQAALAKTLRCQQSLIARIESGERRIDLVELVIISRAMGINAVELLDRISVLVPLDAGL